MLKKVLEKDKEYFIFASLNLAKLGSDALASPFDEAKAIVSDEFCKMSIDFDETKKRVIKLAKLGSDALASPFDEAKAIVSDEFCKMSINFLEFKGLKDIKKSFNIKENLEEKEKNFIQKLEPSLIEKIESSLFILDLIVKQKSLNLTKDDKIF